MICPSSSLSPAAAGERRQLEADNTTKVDDMNVKLKPGFGAVRNRTNVVLDDRLVIGEMQMHRRSGWTGGPNYIFFPNAEGEKIKIRVFHGAKVRTILKAISAMIGSQPTQRKGMT